LTFGIECVEAIKQAKQDKAAKGETLSLLEAGKIIDDLYTKRHPEPLPTLFPLDSKPISGPKDIPPTPDSVTAYSASIGYPLDGQKWCDSYAQKGWTVGRGKMRDWQAAVRNWKTNDWAPQGMKATPKKETDYSKF
jgi:hypothetical protein